MWAQLMLNIDLNDNVHTITIIIITIFLHKIVVKYKLLNHTFHYDTRKYSFSACIVNIWNSVPNYVVDVDTVCLFKTRLDKFWMHQEVMYDFAADLTGIGDRSVRKIS